MRNDDLEARLAAHHPVRSASGTLVSRAFAGLLEAVTPDALAACIPDLLQAALGVSDAHLALRPRLTGKPASCAVREVTVTAAPGASDVHIPLVDGAAVLSFRFPGERAALRAALPAINELTDLIQLRLGGLLRIDALQESLSTTTPDANLQQALYAISSLAYADLDMHHKLRRIHAAIRNLVWAENLLVVLYDAPRETMQVLYYVDTAAPDTLAEGDTITRTEHPHSLTLALLRHGRPLMGSSSAVRRELGLPSDTRLGPHSTDWLGVPMLDDEEVRGAVVVQAYDHQHHYRQEDLALLTFVAQHTLWAITRRDTHNELTRQVARRTQQLADVNRALRTEVVERERRQQLQTALFRMMELAGERGTLHDFFATVHGIIGGLLDARNFFIALVTAKGTELDFTYFVDELDSSLATRRLTNGISEYVIRTRAPLLADQDRIRTLTDSGEVVLYGAVPQCWLGVPLLVDARCVGVMAVQSYDAHRYTPADRDLLLFASYHVATALERKQAQDRLERANAQLEQRVAMRTQELQAANAQLQAQIDVRREAEAKLQHQALHDSLTGLPNRAALLTRLDQALQRYRDSGTPFAILFMDLDRFKVVNDSVGHLIGDELLIEAGRRLRRCVRAQDYVARLGGDEFTVLLEPVGGAADAERVADQIVAAMGDPIMVGGQELYTSASIGIAVSAAYYTSGEEMLRDADVAMYRAKAAGRQRYVVFDRVQHEQALAVLDLERDLRRAMQRHEFEPYLQPLVRLSDGKVEGYEALLRWNHAERGLLSPTDFLDVAEDAGVIEQIDWQLFRDVCQALDLLADREAFVAINVSARHFRRPQLAAQLLQLLRDHGVSSRRIRVEVTEGTLLDNPQQASRTMLTLRDAGVLTVLDDFGTGYSSLSYLHRFPLHALKVDRSFVSGLTPALAGSAAAVTRTIVALARTLDLDVIAEGVETVAQRDALLALQCPAGQGFLFSPPRPFAEFARAV